MEQTHEYQRDEHRVHLIIYHLIWCPRRRKPVLVGPVAARCLELLAGKCAETGWHVLALAVQPDHIHLFVRVWPSDSAAEVVKECKGATSFQLRKEFPHLLTTALYVDTQLLRQHGGQCEPGDHSAVHRRADEALTWWRPCARPTRRSCGRRPPRSGRWRKSCGAAARSTTRRLEQRITAWQRRRVSVSRYRAGSGVEGHSRGVAGIRGHPQPYPAGRAGPAGQDLSGVLPPGPARREGRLPAFQGRATATTPSPTRSTATARGWTMASWCSSKIGRISVHWSRPFEGTPKTVTISQRGGWLVCGHLLCRGADAAAAATGQETGIDLGLESFATLADGQPDLQPQRYYRKAEAYLRRCQRRVARRKKGSHRRRKRWRCSPKRI